MQPDDAVRQLFTVRPAVLADLAALTAVDAKCFPPGIAYPPQEIGSLLRARNAISLIAECSETVAGFASARVLRRRSAGNMLCGELITIDILAEFRRQRIAWRLYDAIESWLYTRGAARIELHVAVDNWPAIQLYQRLGYLPVARIPGYYMETLDAWKMEKLLPDRPSSAGDRTPQA